MLRCSLFIPNSLTILKEVGGYDLMGEVLIIFGGIRLELPTPRYPADMRIS